MAKLSGSRFDPEGLVAATFLEHLKSALPGLQFLPMEKWGADAGPIDEAAMLKSSEEHDVIRRSVAAGEKAIEVIRSVARSPSRHQGDIWFQTYVAMFAETGEDPTRLSIALDAEANTTLGAPTDDTLNEGQIINEEIDATVQGYRGQVNHSIFVGGAKTAGYDYYRATVETAIKLFHECVAFIVPEPGQHPDEAEVKRFALANAPAYQHPRFVWSVDKLPLASTNKIDRAALRRMAQDRVAARSAVPSKMWGRKTA